MSQTPHQYIERQSSRIVTEDLVADGIVTALYSRVRERTPWLFNAVTSARASRLLGYLNYDMHKPGTHRRILRLMHRLSIDAEECLDDPLGFQTARDLFERRIRYWECRPMPSNPDAVVAPADAKMLVGNLGHHPLIHIKEQFFCIEELLGKDKSTWCDTFGHGSFAVFRLTPDKYHYNHVPVDGQVLDSYEVGGRYHSCNPGAVIHLATPLSKNRRVVTILDTDTPDGTGVGKVAMVEIVALMIGDIVQCYSADGYAAPVPAKTGMMLKKGQPKSLFRPGSSTVLLIFEKQRIHFDADIVENRHRRGASSRYAMAFSTDLIETDVSVRSQIAKRRATS